jgi:uncharacterized protein YprB with RNaseH-like and TPR domain
MDINKLLFFDIETVSSYQTLTEMRDNNIELFNLWYKYKDMFINRSEEEFKDDDEKLFMRTASLYPEFSKIICISYGFITKKGEFKIESACDDDEKDILMNFNLVLDKCYDLGYHLCGHNIKLFDIPYLIKRLFINNINVPKILPRHDTKPWEFRVIDTRDVWSSNINRGLSSLDSVCVSLGIDSPKNGDINGYGLYEFYYSDKKNLDVIQNYCESDVKSVMEVIKKINNLY